MGEQQRDLAKDLEICEAGTKGPVRWQKFGESFYLTGQYGMRPIILATIKTNRAGRGHISVLVDGLLRPLTPDHPDAIKIEESWEGWPHAIRRALEAEAENERLRKRIKEEWENQDTLAKTGSNVIVENEQLRGKLKAVKAMKEFIDGYVIKADDVGLPLWAIFPEETAEEVRGREKPASP